jgi:glucosamine-6-phosphate deaminase
MPLPIKTNLVRITISESPKKLGQIAGKAAGNTIRKILKEKGSANILLATGASQFETLNQLLSEEAIDWNKVVVFHLDEYLGLPITHPASFRKYLKERFIDKVGALGDYHLINGEADPEAECERIGDIISRHPIDVALVGIGENGHLAFNDPPADFQTEEPYIVVELDEPCRKQQLNEGWFKTMESVPQRAISMSIKQILKSKHILCSVPDKRKAIAVRDCLENEVSNTHPASILKQHENCHIYLDTASAGLLPKKSARIEL